MVACKVITFQPNDVIHPLTHAMLLVCNQTPTTSVTWCSLTQQEILVTNTHLCQYNPGITPPQFSVYRVSCLIPTGCSYPYQVTPTCWVCMCMYMHTQLSNSANIHVHVHYYCSQGLL